MDDDESGTEEISEFNRWWQANGGKAAKKQASSGFLDMRECEGVHSEHEFGEPMTIVVETSKKPYTLKPPAEAEEYWFQLLRKSAPESTRVDGSPGTAVAYECTLKALLREGAELDSAYCEYPNVSVLPGSTIEILEARHVDGQIRVRCERGWTSVADGSGVVQLEPVGGTAIPPPPAPEPEPEAEAEDWMGTPKQILYSTHRPNLAVGQEVGHMAKEVVAPQETDR